MNRKIEFINLKDVLDGKSYANLVKEMEEDARKRLALKEIYGEGLLKTIDSIHKGLNKDLLQLLRGKRKRVKSITTTIKIELKDKKPDYGVTSSLLPGLKSPFSKTKKGGKSMT